MKTTSLALVALVATVTTPALADHSKELDVQRGPTSELYIRKRPPTPEAPVLSAELQDLLNKTEKRRDDKRIEAIGELRSFLTSKPIGDVKADGMFKLAELLWEEARRLFLIRMDAYGHEVEKCSQQKAACDPPKEPKIDLKESETLYKELKGEFPGYKRMDLVTYLIGFAAKEDQREDEAMGNFQEVIAKYPTSPLYGDAWMMIGEHWFGTGKNWEEAKDAYEHVPDSAATSDLATFKSAWCYWKLGNSMKAAELFKAVLDKRKQQELTGTAEQKRRSQSLAEEALDYLVVVFTEDRSLSAKEVFAFLQSINGEEYSHDVMIKVAESYASQTEYDRSNDAFKFLINMDPDSIKAAEYQRSIVTNWNSAGDPDKAEEEIKALLETYGPASPWAKAQKNRDALARSMDTTEELVRVSAQNIHAVAQQREKSLKLPELKHCATKVQIPAELVGLYTRAADAYSEYLSAFADSKAAAEHATEIRYYRADILCFKLAKGEEAGDEYLAVGKTAPVGKLHKPALLNAIDAFEAARPKDTQGKHQVYPVDEKFGEALDLYATLFPGDPAIIGQIYKNGQMFYDYGDYDNAIKRFGVIVTRYPKNENAGPAGDKILAALGKAKDFENLETWARKLKTAPSFQGKDRQELLSKLIVESIQRSGDKFSDAGKYDKAAKFYLRVPKETNDVKVASQAMMNAGKAYELAKKPEDAADVYLDVAEQYGDKDPGIGQKAAFTAGVVYEKVLFFDRAAKAYELVVKKYSTGKDTEPQKASDALYNAGVLRQALGQNDKAIEHYKAYAKKGGKDAGDVSFNIGAVYEESGQDGPAMKAFEDYARTNKGSKHTVEANLRAGRTAYKLGNTKKAEGYFAATLAAFKRLPAKDQLDARPFAGEARYFQGEVFFKTYEAISLDVPPKKLTVALKAKLKALANAEKIYKSVAEYKDAKWGSAALFRIGQVYSVFADALTVAGSKCPAGLSEGDCQAYQDTINGYVINTQDKAVTAYTTGYETALKLQVYDEYTAKIRAELGKLDSAKFPPEHEARSHERVGDRPPNPEMITEVAR